MAKKLPKPDQIPTHEEIEKRAHELYEQSGSIPGRDMENWLQAEAELSSALQSEPAAQETSYAAMNKPEPRSTTRPASRANSRRQ